MNTSVGRYDGVQALRLGAALLVVVMHSIRYASERLYPEMPTLIWNPGNSGVDVFFVISGFVITIASVEQVRSGAWRDFLARRLARIVPLYWFLTTVKIAITAAMPTVVLHAKISTLPIVLSYLFLPSTGSEGTIFPFMGVGWTLNFEMFFYALFTLALVFRRDPLWFCGTILLVTSAGALIRDPNWPAISFYLDSIVLEFLMGMVLARAVLAGRQMNRFVAIGLAVAGTLLLVLPPFELDAPPRFIGRGIPAMLLVTGVVYMEQIWRGRVPRFLVDMGDSSYALYLIHPFVAPAIPLILYKFGIIDLALSAVLGILASLIAGWFAWQWIDRPLTRAAGRLLVAKTRRRPKSDIPADASW